MRIRRALIAIMIGILFLYLTACGTRRKRNEDFVIVKRFRKLREIYMD